MALRIPDDELNPGQIHADNTFDALKKAETNGNSLSNGDEVKDKEQKPASDWVNNVTGQNKNQQPSGFNKFKSLAKKKSATIAIIGILLGSSVGIGGFLSTGLLLVQIKEVMVGKFNSQLASMDIRSTKILASKMGTTGGICTSVIDIRCKYSSMSEKQIANFEKAGIKISSDEKTLFGRTKPTNFEFNGKTISAAEFSSEIGTNPEFRSAVKNAYNPKFAGFADSIWSKVTSNLKISKSKAKISGDTEDAKLKSIQENTKFGSVDAEQVNIPKAGDINPDSGNPYTDEEINKIKNASNVAEDIITNTEEIAKKGKKIAPEIIEKGAKASIAMAGSALKITGFADSACTAYTTIQAVGYAAKMVRTIQLARYAMIFLNVADQIKAGEAKEEDVSYLGKILTSEVTVNEATNTKAKLSATDSFGYKYAAYGEAGNMPDSTMQYLAAGGLTGSLIGITSLVNSTLNGKPRSVCGFLANPIVGGVSAIAGIALLIFGAPVGAAKVIAQGVFAASIAVAIMALPAMLQDIVAGVLVDKTTIGADAGDALTSGASGLMGSTAAAGGNAPLTPAQAVAYNNLSNNIAAQYNEEDQLTASQFDINNSNGFLGSLVSTFIPYLSKLSSLSGIFSSIASISSNSISALTNKTASASISSYDYAACQDFDYNDIQGDGSGEKVATDPFCNVSYGMPQEALDIDPIEVVDILINPDTSNKRSFPQIDLNSGAPKGKYITFINDCIDRKRPLGDPGTDNNESSGSECLYGKTIQIAPAVFDKGKLIFPEVSINNKYFYLSYIDQRVQKGMDGEDPVLAAAQENGLNSISFFDNYNYNTTAMNASGN